MNQSKQLDLGASTLSTVQTGGELKQNCVCAHTYLNTYIPTNAHTYVHINRQAQTHTQKHTLHHIKIHKVPAAKQLESENQSDGERAAAKRKKEKERHSQPFQILYERKTFSQSCMTLSVLLCKCDSIRIFTMMPHHPYFSVWILKKSLRLVLLLKNLSIQFRNWLTQKNLDQIPKLDQRCKSCVAECSV